MHTGAQFHTSANGLITTSAAQPHARPEFAFEGSVFTFFTGDALLVILEVRGRTEKPVPVLGGLGVGGFEGVDWLGWRRRGRRLTLFRGLGLGGRCRPLGLGRGESAFRILLVNVFPGHRLGSESFGAPENIQRRPGWQWLLGRGLDAGTVRVSVPMS